MSTKREAAIDKAFAATDVAVEKSDKGFDVDHYIKIAKMWLAIAEHERKFTIETAKLDK